MTESELSKQFTNVKAGDLGIIGDPIEHSLSPRMQGPALKHWWTSGGRSADTAPTYHKFQVKSDQLENALKLIRERKLLGINVTVPHKKDVCAFVDVVDGFAAGVGSVNTIRSVNGRLYGFNTDADGFQRSLIDDLGFSPQAKTTLVLGAGGTGVVLMQRLLDLGAEKVFYWNRNSDKQIDLRGDASKVVRLKTPQEIAREIAKVDLVVNATSVGLKDKDPMPVEPMKFKKNQFVFDVIYNRKTKFLKEARSAGAITANGMNMLLYQGARAFEIWTGAPAPLEIMKKGLISR